MGTPFLAKEILNDLIKKKVPIHTVITQPDRPVGRNQTQQMPEVKETALENKIPFKQFEKIGSEELDFFENEKPDIIIVAAYGLILPKRLVKMPKFGIINVHASLLPKLRGASPIQTALLTGEEETGVTIMLIEEKMDTGNILSQKAVTIDPDNKYPRLEKKMISTSNELLLPTLKNWINKKIKPRKQNDSVATYSKVINKKSGLTDWGNTAQEIYNQFRAFYVWPKIYTHWNGKRLTLNDISKEDPSGINLKPGKVNETEKGIAVGTNDGLIILNKVQLEGKKEMPIDDFVNGHPDFLDSRLR